MGIFFSSAITVLISLVDTNRLGAIVQWLLGNVAPVPPAALTVFALVTLVGFAVILADARRLNLLALGEDAARELGVDALAVKRRIFAGAALLVSAVVAFAGPIGFVGLIVPHAPPHAAGPGQPRPRARGGAGRRDLPARGRYARAQRRRARRAFGRRAHRLLRRAVLRLLAARARPPGAAVTPVIELRDVGYTYPARGATEGARAPFSLRDVSLAVAPGEILGVVGPNASGKTTLIRLLSRLLAPDRGVILLEGEPMARLTRAAVATRVGVVPQDVPAGFPYTVEELVLMGRFPHGPRRFFESRRRTGASPGRPWRPWAWPGCAREPCDRLSGGERQRVMLARALAQRPRLLVLDEPTAHLDLRYQAECVALLRDLQRHGAGAALSVVLVSHDLDLAAHLCHRLLLLAGGRPARLGPPDAVLEEATLEAVYGCPVAVDKHPAQRPAERARRLAGAGDARGEVRAPGPPRT